MTRKIGVAVLAAAGLLLAGCAQPGVPVAAPPTATSTVTTHPTTKPATSAPAPPAAPAAEQGDPPECHVQHVSAAIQPGDSLGHGVFETSIELTNRGPGPCTLYGSSQLELFTANGAPLGIKEIRSDRGAKLITVHNGRTASMSLRYSAPYLDEPASCLPVPAVAELTLPADEDERIDANLADPAFGMPAVCGPVTVTPWSQPG
jgi:Domain of unknown function (DUF4232)